MLELSDRLPAPGVVEPPSRGGDAVCGRESSAFGRTMTALLELGESSNCDGGSGGVGVLKPGETTGE